MPKLVSDRDWDAYRSLMMDAHDTFHQKDIVWKRATTDISIWGEDPTTPYVDVHIKGLLNDNYRRSWPITQATDAGKLDRESTQLLLNKDYLRNNGWLNNDGYFDFKRDEDLFVIDGITYRPSGDTPTGQAHDDEVMFAIILKREESPSA
jgi:hypothetical protein